MNSQVRAGICSRNPPILPGWVRWILLVTFLLMAFDFRGDQESGYYQRLSFLISLSLVCVGILPYLSKKSFYPSKVIQLSSLFLSIFVIGSLLSAAVHSYDFQKYIIVAAPYLIMASNFVFIGLICRRHGVDSVAEYILPLIAVASLASSVWHIFYGAINFGGSLSGLRYKTISPLLPFALAIFFAMYHVGYRKIASRLVLIMLLLVIFVSQTRSYLLTLAVVVLLVIYGHSKGQLQFSRKLILISLVSVLILLFLYLSGGVGSEIIKFWVARMLGSSSAFGFDLTTATRLAEYHSQMNCLFSSGLNMALGCGIGAPYNYSGYYADFVRDVLGEKGVVQGYWNGGHSLWVYTLYSSGLIFGLGLNVLFAFCCMSAFFVVHKYRKQPLSKKHTPIMAASALVAIVSTGFTGFPLGMRSSAFFMGILMAIVVAYYVNLRKRPMSVFE